MNPETIIELQNKISELEETISTLSKTVAALTIDKQYMIKVEKKIQPGTACKVIFNEDGVITGVEKLNRSDTPWIDELEQRMDKALSAERTVSISEKDFERLHNVEADALDTGCKVTYDKRGHVVSVAPLCESDIPALPIEKIIGLKESLSTTTTALVEQVDEPIIPPGTACKVRYNSKGQIISSSKLSVTDIPKEIIERINTIDASLLNLAPLTAVTNLNKSILTKLDANPRIEPGWFMKVLVDHKGLVVQGDKLDINDLPEISIDNIKNLRQSLNEKASQSELNTLREEVNIIANNNAISKVATMINDAISHKADMSNITEVNGKIRELSSRIDSIQRQLPSDQLSMEIKSLHSMITEINGKITVLEQKAK